MKPIYKPKGAAAEYADYALNTYTGCTNGCAYCYAPGVLRKSKEDFSKNVTVRTGLIEGLRRQLTSGNYEGKTIHLCFTCDPYPYGVDIRPTREVIKLLKAAKCHVQILTKRPDLSQLDWDLLDGEDWVGTTYSGDDSQERNTLCQAMRLVCLSGAKKHGFRTWVSCEPVLEPEAVYELIREGDYIDLFKIGKLNHHRSDIDWASFGREAKRLCEEYSRNYVLKESLLKEMRRK